MFAFITIREQPVMFSSLTGVTEPITVSVCQATKQCIVKQFIGCLVVFESRCFQTTNYVSQQDTVEQSSSCISRISYISKCPDQPHDMAYDYLVYTSFDSYLLFTTILYIKQIKHKKSITTTLLLNSNLFQATLVTGYTLK